MKKLISVLLPVILCLALAACSSPAMAQEARSNKPRDLSPQVNPAELAELINGNSKFALDLYQALKGEDGNLFFSPYSLNLALAMAYAGAREETRAQMKSTLDITLGDDLLHEAFNFLALELAKRETVPGLQGKDENGFRFNVVNDAWGQKNYQFDNSYLDTLAVNYNAGVRLVDFIKDAEGARKTINDYIEEKTEGRIKDLIPEGAIDSMTRLVLTNAIYFNAAWASTFDKNNTITANFNLLDGTKISVPMMRQTQFYRYASGENHQAIELPYTGNQISMVIILPHAGQFDSVENSLNAAEVSKIINGLNINYVNLNLPKFEFSSDFGLADTLKAMGMPSAFDPTAADFSGITGKRDLYITDVVHKAFVSTDENGTEAAAASGVMMGTTSLPPEPVVFTADRPFIFLIRDIPTGAILFVGRVLNPGA
jgi:serpin B